MPKNKFQDVVFTAIMATIMVYGMVVYNVALNTGDVSGATFVAALHELPIMVPIAFILEFFVVGKIARGLAFSVMTPQDRPQFITYAISICICCIMCPTMSLIATFLFKEPSFGTWIKTWAMNFPMAICWQMFYCGPLVRLIFRLLFERKEVKKRVEEEMLAENWQVYLKRRCKNNTKIVGIILLSTKKIGYDTNKCIYPIFYLESGKGNKKVIKGKIFVWNNGKDHGSKYVL